MSLEEKIVKHLASNLWREPSCWGLSLPQHMADPYGLLDLLVDSGIDPNQIDTWMCEAQGIDKGGEDA